MKAFTAITRTISDSTRHHQFLNTCDWHQDMDYSCSQTEKSVLDDPVELARARLPRPKFQYFMNVRACATIS